MANAFVVFPNQLFKDLPPGDIDLVILVEAKRYFSDFNFHKKKLILHRASLQYYKDFLEKKKLKVVYLDHESICKQKSIAAFLKSKKIKTASFYDPIDHKLTDQLEKDFKSQKINCTILESPIFICSPDYLKNFFATKTHYSMNSFYIEQRKRLEILTEDSKPIGGKWSFDKDNREKFNKSIPCPELCDFRKNKYVKEAIEYIEKHFPSNPGSSDNFFYPVTHNEAKKWLTNFLEDRLDLFGPYEDSISKDESFLFHSLLSAPLNAGLLKPLEVVNSAIEFAKKNQIRLNSLEGFVRQIIGWREFMRAIYILKGEKERTSNFWNFKNKIPNALYNGTTKIPPIDIAIEKLLQNSYLHHIERLMLIGNFMLLCKIHPQEAYRWFMELFIDAYDWVMVPNIFGMSQYADGGMITTKPYISSSNYILKMSDFKKDIWCDIWDSLFWNFINEHKKVFTENPRMKIMAIQLERKGKAKIREHQKQAEDFLEQLYKS